MYLIKEFVSSYANLYISSVFSLFLGKGNQVTMEIT